MGVRGTRLAVLVVFAVLAFAAAGEAGGPGTWTRISDPSGRNIDEVGLARTGDGVLHVAWQRRSANRESLLHTPIAANGSAGAATPIVDGWASANYPALVVAPDGSLRAFFGGIRSTNAGETNNSLNTATAPASGSPWTLQAGKAAAHTAVYPSGVGAAMSGNGTPVVVWNDSCPGCNGFHFGTTPATPDFRYEKRGCCAYFGNAAVDAATGETAIAWYSNVDNASGIYSQSVTPGGPAGDVQFAPGSATADRKSSLAPTGKIGMTSRRGAPGIYLAYGQGYPTYQNIIVWRHGTSSPVFGLAASRARHINITSGPEGRLWLMWERSGRLYATRTNKAATRPGAIVSTPPPAGTSTVWRLTGEGSGGPLDLLAHVSTPSSLATWHTQMLPGLLVQVRAGKRTATISVTEAGDPIGGAAVKIGKRRLVTNARGTATAKLAKGRYTASVSRAGYAAAKASFRVR
jgi:hypothetical protein